MTRVFVYGTLKRGGRNHHFMAGQPFLGEARTEPGYTLYSLGDYPGMVRSADASHAVTGEVWGVNADCLARLDELEGVTEGLYERVPVRLAASFAHQPIETYLYLRSLEGRTNIGLLWSE